MFHKPQNRHYLVEIGITHIDNDLPEYRIVTCVDKTILITIVYIESIVLPRKVIFLFSSWTMIIELQRNEL